MAVPTNTFKTFESIGNREDLSDIISNIDPTITPFTSNIGTKPVKATKHEWQLDNLTAASDANAKLEGDDAAAAAITPTVRVGNFTQISDKVFQISGTEETIDKAGRKSEVAYQRVKNGVEIRRDVEKQMLSNKASVAGAAGTARQSAGLESWLTTNVDRGATGANGGFQAGTGLVTAPTDGTLRAFTEAQLQAVQLAAFNAGGRPTALYMGGALKQKFSAFAGIAAIRNQANDSAATIVGAADVYIGDFGTLTAVPHPYGVRARSAILVDHTKVHKGVLRGMFDQTLAKTGDSEKHQMIEEYTLIVDNEAACGIVADAQ